MVQQVELTDENVAEESPHIAYQLVSQVSASVAFGVAADQDHAVIDLKDQLLQALDMIKDDMPLVEIEGQKWSQEEALDNVSAYLTTKNAVENLYTGLGKSETLKIYSKLQKVMTQYAMDHTNVDRIIDDVRSHRVQTISDDEPVV